MKTENDKFIIETEKEMFLYWLCQTYHALGREGYEQGRTLEELREEISDVLNNAGFDPHHTIQGQNLAKAEPVYFINSELK